MHTRSKTYKNRRLFFRVRRNSADKGSNPFTVFSVSCSFSSLCLNSQQTKSEVKVKEIDWRGLGANFLHVASVAQKLAKRERENVLHGIYENKGKTGNGASRAYKNPRVKGGIGLPLYLVFYDYDDLLSDVT